MARRAILNANASLYLDGNAGYLTIPITPSPTGFSFGVWIETGRRTTASSSIYMSSTGAAFTDGFILNRGIGRGDIEFIGYNTTNSVNTSLRTGQISDGQWVHVVVTYLPSGVCNMYQDGILANTVTATNTITTGTTSVYIGRRSHAATFAGLNASGLVWHNTTTPWTAAQVLALYQSGTVPTGATAVYPLSEGAGSIAYDTSGNGNNGTITSGTWSKDTPAKTRSLVSNNLIYNGDFEFAPVVNVPTTTQFRWIDGTASGNNTSINIFGWAVDSITGTAGAMYDSGTKRSGDYSLKLSTTATSSPINISIRPTAASRPTNRVPLLPNTSYTVTAYIKTSLVSGSATTGARLQVLGLSGDNATTVQTVTVVSGLVTTTDFTQYTATFTTGATVRFAFISLSVVGNDGTGTLIMDAWFDDLQLYPTTAITRSVATGRSLATGRSAS